MSDPNENLNPFDVLQRIRENEAILKPIAAKLRCRLEEVADRVTALIKDVEEKELELQQLKEKAKEMGL